MTDEQQQHDIEPPKETGNVTTIERPKIDFYLQSLVNMANDHGTEIGITLVLGGTVLTGTLISGPTYFKAFSEAFAAAWPGDAQAKEDIRESLALPSTRYGQGKTEAVGASFIHLKGATVRTPNGYLPESGMLWRGRLTEVSGFMLGSIS